MPGRDRLIGVDAARAVALVGMVATHVLPLTDRGSGDPTAVATLFSGRASALFAVLAGVGIALSTGGVRRPPDARAQLAAGIGIAVRALLVALLGLALADLDPYPLVILAYYGVLFVVAIPLLRLPAPVLAGLAVVWCVVGPVLSHLLRDRAEYVDQVGLAALRDPGELLWALTVSGVYPVLTWTTYLLAGLAAGRSDLRDPRVAAGLAVGGAVGALVAHGGSRVLLGPLGGAAALPVDATADRFFGTVDTDTWWWLAVSAPHTGTPFDLAATTGSALAVLGVALLLARVAPRWLWLPAAVGGAPLTLYTLHVVLTVSTGSPAQGAAVYVGHLVVLTLVGVALRAFGLRGPLEAVVGRSAAVATRLVARPAPAQRPS